MVVVNLGLDISAGEEGDVFHVDWIHWDAADVDFLACIFVDSAVVCGIYSIVLL